MRNTVIVEQHKTVNQKIEGLEEHINGLKDE